MVDSVLDFMFSWYMNIKFGPLFQIFKNQFCTNKMVEAASLS